MRPRCLAVPRSSLAASRDRAHCGCGWPSDWAADFSWRERSTRGMTGLLLIFLRVLAVCVSMNALGAPLTMLLRWRVAFAVVLTIVASPMVPAMTSLDPVSGGPLPAMMAAELLVGASFGFGLALWFLGADVCAQLWTHLSGLSIDAFGNGAERPAQRFFHLIWLNIFFLAGGHRMALTSFLDGFRIVPPGTLADCNSLLQGIITQLTLCMRMGLQAGLPVAAALFAAIVATAVAGRLIPQMQTFVTTTSIGALLLVACLAVGVTPLMLTLELQVTEYFSSYWEQRIDHASVYDLGDFP